VFSIAGICIYVLTVVVTQDKPPCPARSAGVGGGGSGPEVAGIPAPSGAGGVSVDGHAGATSLPERTSGSAQRFRALNNLAKRVTRTTKKEGDGNEVRGGNPNTSREIAILSEKLHAHESSPVTWERSPDTRVLSRNVSQTPVLLPSLVA